MSPTPRPGAPSKEGPARPPAQDAPPPFLRVTEIFHSIQGESTWAGAPCTFIRLTGCPLRCVWCDTDYSFHGGTKMSLDDIMARIREIGCPLVEITGGEPLIHRNTFVLAERLVEEGYTVLVETSGSEDISPLPAEVHTIMDLKCPGSGEVARNRWENLEHLSARDEVKFVVLDRADYEWSRKVIRERGLDRRVRDGSLRALLLSPVWGDLEWRELAEWVLEDQLPVRFQLQLHKLIWGPDEKGV